MKCLCASFFVFQCAIKLQIHKIISVSSCKWFYSSTTHFYPVLSKLVSFKAGTET